MNVFNLLGHLGLLIHCGKDIQAIVQNLVQKKESFPSAAEFKVLVDDSIEILKSDLLGLPADVKQKMIDALSTLKAQLFPEVAPAV